MTALKDTLEWNLGRFGEERVRCWYQQQGWFVVPTYCIENGGAPALIGQLRRFVLPDMQAAQAGEMRWVEVKTKTSPVLYQKIGRFRHGIDLRNWLDYREVERTTGLPGYLAILQLRPGKGAAVDPVLLQAAFADLDSVVQIYTSNQMVYWDADRFERLPIDLTQAAPVLEPKTIHPWDHGREMGPKQEVMPW